MYLKAFVTAWSIVAPAAMATAAAPTSFCMRSGASLSMERVVVKDQTVWRKPLMGLGAHLFGGSSTVMMAVSTVDGATEAVDYAKLQKVCRPNKKGMDCAVEGPMMLTVSIKGVDFPLEARTGDQADFRMTGSRLECVDKPTR